MIRIWTFFKTHFLTRKFLTFGIIGVANTGIHMLMYFISYNNIVLMTNLVMKAFWSNTIAFVAASIFSYFANAIFTFKPNKKSTRQFSIVMGVYLLRWFISSSLTSLFDSIFVNVFNFDYSSFKYLELLAPLLASALLIPIAYFALDWVFRKTDKEKNNITL